MSRTSIADNNNLINPAEGSCSIDSLQRSSNKLILKRAEIIIICISEKSALSDVHRLTTLLCRQDPILADRVEDISMWLEHGDQQQSPAEAITMSLEEVASQYRELTLR